MVACGQGDGAVMSHISLGSITPNKNSLFRVKAQSSTGVPLEYFYYSGKLPPGLTVDPSGEIFGITKTHIFDLDEGITTIDAGATTIDRKFNFTVKAINKNNVLSSTHPYSITERKLTNDEIANIYLKLSPDKATKLLLDKIIADSKIFPTETLYRMSDKNFKTGDKRVLFLSGVHSPDLTDLFGSLGRNFYNTKLKLGGIKVGKAKDPNGNVIYECVYAELIDAYATASNTSTSSLGTVYSNSISKMRDALKSQLTVDSYEYLPQWMKSAQDTQGILGYTLALPLRYVLPGQGDLIQYKLEKESTFDFKQVHFEIERLYISKHTGTTIDDTRTLGTATGDGSTTTFILPQRVTQAKNVQVTIGGVGINTHDNSGNELYSVEPIDDSTQQDSASADSSALYTSLLTFTGYGAPADGSAITFKRKKTTFGLKEYATFDKPNESLPPITADSINQTADTTVYETSYIPTVETTFDAQGTRFDTQPVTFDQKQPEDSQLIFARENVLEGINNTSKHRDLVRKAI